jgi:hypothetical protein
MLSADSVHGVWAAVAIPCQSVDRLLWRQKLSRSDGAGGNVQVSAISFSRQQRCPSRGSFSLLQAAFLGFPFVLCIVGSVFDGLVFGFACIVRSTAGPFAV